MYAYRRSIRRRWPPLVILLGTLAVFWIRLAGGSADLAPILGFVVAFASLVSLFTVRGRVGARISILLLGVLLLLDELDVLPGIADVRPWNLWPILLILNALYLMVPRHRRDYYLRR